MRLGRVTAVCAVAATILSPPATACFLDHGVVGLSVIDPASIPVLVATRRAEAEGTVEVLRRTDPGLLLIAVLTLAQLHGASDGVRLERAMRPFSVLQVQSAYWTRYGIEDGAVVVEPHRPGAEPGDTVVVVADSTLLALARGRLDVAQAREAGLIAIRGPAPEATASELAAAIDRFRAHSPERELTLSTIFAR